ncbi:MAG TPA: bifunctional heptose 7-phosphate kinase/heptose 1-phosphate adenyltransferase [Sedimentisphaerales bacterium]|nr:bifunctional heptose 7-phosphate kinase/heptose 1-phosphate adenyltransferase [Sedimentisphaerales bacterium]
MYERLLKTIGNLGAPKILVVGDFMLDVYIFGDAVRISPEAPVPVLKVTETESRCGGAASVAADIAALGAAPLCVGVLGQDANGDLLKKQLTAIGADLSGLVEAPERSTTTRQRLIGLAQHRHRQQLMRIDQECADPMPEPICQEVLGKYRQALEQADIVCLQDCDKGLLSPAVCKEMIRLAKEAGLRVLVDPTHNQDYSKYTGATLLTPNRCDASTVVGFEVHTPNDAAKAARQLAEALCLDAVVITLDKDGAYLSAGEIRQMIPARARNVYDVTGAGDVVLATLAVSLAAESNYLTAAHLANIAAGIEVERFGATPVTASEMIHEIADQYGARNVKLRSIDSLMEELNWRKSRGQTIVFTNGCFDVIHRGHIEYLRFCKAQGDVVVVGLNSDSSVRALKGPERPINSQFDRAAVLSGLETVDFITIFDDPSVLGLVKKVKPDVLIKGADWGSKGGVVGSDFVESYGGKVMLAPLVQGKSSTATIEKMKTLQGGES